MRPRSIALPASCLTAAALAVSACNLVFGVVPGELGTGGAGGTGGLGTSSSSAGGGGASSSSSSGTGGMGGGPACTADTATCEGAVLHACGPDGKPLPDVTCPVIAACDAAARACVDAATIPRLSVGDTRSCFIEDDRTVRCWGSNGGGDSLINGDGHFFLTTATPAPGVAGVRQISVGKDAQCVVNDDAEVLCWGSNYFGELGSPGATEGMVVKAALPAGVHAVEVSAAYACACARAADGSVYCWGARDAGCLGDGVPAQGTQDAPGPVAGVTDAVQIRTGSGVTPACARRADGKVLCWADTIAPKEVPNVSDAIDVAVGRRVVFIRSASKGILWTARTADDKAWRPAATYAVSGAVKAMAAGDAFCALRDDDTVVCAQLSDSVPPPPPSATAIQPAGTVTEISAGYSQAYAAGVQCARVEGAAAKVQCWGDDLLGTLGAGSPELLRAPQKASGVASAAFLAAGSGSTAAVLADGSVSGWGLARGLSTSQQPLPKAVGFLGNDNARVATDDYGERAYVVKKSGAPALLEDAVPLANQRLLTTGYADFTAAVGLSTWDLGLRAGGQLVLHSTLANANDGGLYGDGTTTTAAAPQNVDLAAPAGVTAFAAYGDWYNAEPGHICAIHGAGGALSCWGDNYNGEIGDGTSGNVVSAPALVSIPNNEAIVSAAVGRYFTCAASSAGKVYCWGSNGRGALGDASIQTVFAFPNAVPGVSAAVEVAAGEAHACARRSDQTVVCWGANDSGQVGDGTLDDATSAKQVPGLTGVVQIVAGAEHTCARHADGSVSCWGSSYNGQSGTGATGYYAEPQAVIGL